MGFVSGYSQYLSNPSLEGQILMIGPPPGWSICNFNSSPNVQPGKYDVFLPPSDGITYLGMLTRPDFTWEDVQSPLDVPLSKDSCYRLKVDLAFWQNLSFTVASPCLVKVYGGTYSCDKTTLLWQSPAVSNVDWQTYQFIIHNEEFDIDYLVFDAYYVGTVAYYGYVVMDNIRINPTPDIDLGNDTTLTLCWNDSLVLDPGAGFAIYYWQDGSMNQTYSVTTSGTYWVTVFTADGCPATDSITITIPDYIDMTTTMTDPLYVCQGQPVNLWVNVLNGVPAYSYSWVGLPDTTQSVNVIADTTTFYKVIVTDHCGNQIADSVKINVLPAPDIDLGNDMVICTDDSFTLHAGPGYPNYLWYDGSTDSTLTIYGAGTYWVQVTSSFGCTSTDSINIQVFPPVQMSLGEDTLICEGSSITLSPGSGFNSYVWQDNSTSQTFTVFTAGIYWVTVTDQNGCSASDSINIGFLPPPQIDLGDDFDLCEGEQQILTPGPGFLSYVWQDGSTGENFTITQSGTYWVTVFNGCAEDTDSVNVQVHPSPNPDLGPDTTICGGQTLLLDPGNQYVSYQWQDNSSLSFYTVTSSGIYTVEVENNFGCTGSDEIYVTFDEIAVDLGPDNHICEGDSLTLDAGEGFETYLWQDNTTTQTQVVTTAGTFGVNVQDEFGCTASDAIEITLYPYPTANLGNDIEICAGDTLFLQGPEGDFSYYWNGQPGDQNYSVTESGSYSLSVVNLCDSVTDDITVTEIPVPEINLGEDQLILPGQTVELDAGEGFDSYLWQDGSGQHYFEVTENNIDPLNPYYYVEVTKGICKNSDTVKIELFKVWVPKVITLNADGKNDYFAPDPERWQGINKHKMTVFNRWGEVVWESEDFPSGWDGKRNGRYVADGTYFWILEVYYGSQNIKQTLKGSLTVLASGQ